MLIQNQFAKKSTFFYIGFLQFAWINRVNDVEKYVFLLRYITNCQRFYNYTSKQIHSS